MHGMRLIWNYSCCLQLTVLFTCQSQFPSHSWPWCELTVLCTHLCYVTKLWLWKREWCISTQTNLNCKTSLLLAKTYPNGTNNKLLVVSDEEHQSRYTSFIQILRIKASLHSLFLSGPSSASPRLLTKSLSLEPGPCLGAHETPQRLCSDPGPLEPQHCNGTSENGPQDVPPPPPKTRPPLPGPKPQGTFCTFKGTVHPKNESYHCDTK